MLGSEVQIKNGKEAKQWYDDEFIFAFESISLNVLLSLCYHKNMLSALVELC